MKNSIKKNFAYSIVLTVAGYLFPLITFPYVTRVLGASNIGICNFVLSIIGYFIVIANLGMMTVAIREIAAAVGDRERLSRVFSSLLALHLISTLVAMAALVVCTFLIPRFYEHKELLWIGTGQLFFNFLTIEWFYKGIEDFKYITVRSVAVRLIQVVLTFVIVREPDDYVNYFLTGEVTTTQTGLSEQILWDFKENCRADFVADYYGFKHDLFSDIAPSIGVSARTDAATERLLGIALDHAVSAQRQLLDRQGRRRSFEHR